VGRVDLGVRIFTGCRIWSWFFQHGMIGGGCCFPFFDKCRDFRFDLREIVCSSIPDKRISDSKIPFDDHVPKFYQITPRDIQMLPFNRSRDIFFGFSNHDNYTPHSMSTIIIMDEIVNCPVFKNFYRRQSRQGCV